MKPFLFFATVFISLAVSFSTPAAGLGDQVIVVYNTRERESKGVADHYAAMRHVPENQVIGLDMPDREVISRTEFRESIQKPLAKFLEDKKFFHFQYAIIPGTNGEPATSGRRVGQASIRYLVLCYGVPLTISRDNDLHEAAAEKLPKALQRNEAAVDNELAWLPLIDQHVTLAGPIGNPVFGCTNAALLNPTNGVLMVARLDGPTAAIARKLVDKAMEAETNGLWGRAYFDTRGLTDPTTKQGDDWINGAAQICKAIGFETIIDSNANTFPASFPLSQVALYAGWYDEHASGPFARPTVEFVPGAFAYHLQSFSAATLRSTKHQWVGPLLDRGATATMGCVDEPYLGGTPNLPVFFSRFTLSGFTFGEAAYASQTYLSWQVTVVGDPLYSPFGGDAIQLHKDLISRHSKLVEWSYLRTINVNIARGGPLEQITPALENLDVSKTSAVLQEKLGDLYTAIGKPSSSVAALQKALQLDPTPQQRVRVMLQLGKQLLASGQDAEAYENYQQFLKLCPDYPDPLPIYKTLGDLAHKLGHADDAVKYQHEITRLTAPPAPAEKGPPLRKGI